MDEKAVLVCATQGRECLHTGRFEPAKTRQSTPPRLLLNRWLEPVGPGGWLGVRYVLQYVPKTH